MQKIWETPLVVMCMTKGKEKVNTLGCKCWQYGGAQVVQLHDGTIELNTSQMNAFHWRDANSVDWFNSQVKQIERERKEQMNKEKNNNTSMIDVSTMTAEELNVLANAIKAEQDSRRQAHYEECVKNVLDALLTIKRCYPHSSINIEVDDEDYGTREINLMTVDLNRNSFSM